MRRRRLRDLSARDIDEMRRAHDEAELARHDRELEGREPREDVDPVEAARAARVLRERRCPYAPSATCRWGDACADCDRIPPPSFDDFRAWKLGD